LRPVNSLDAPGGVVLPLERHINAERLVLAVGALATADRYLQNVAVLAEELGLAESFEQLILPDCRCQPGHINQVLLNNPDANKVLAILFFGLALLYLLLALFGGSLLLVLLNVRSKLGNLLLCDHFPLDGLVIVGAPTCRAQAIHVRPDVIEAKLANLISTRAWSEVSVGEVELLDAERAAVLLIVDVCVLWCHGCG